MIMFVIETLLGALGVFGFFANIPILVWLGGIIYILETMTGLITGELRNINTTVFTIAISFILSIANHYNVFTGICFGLSIESLLFAVVSICIFCKRTR